MLDKKCVKCAEEFTTTDTAEVLCCNCCQQKGVCSRCGATFVRVNATEILSEWGLCPEHFLETQAIDVMYGHPGSA